MLDEEEVVEVVLTGEEDDDVELDIELTPLLVLTGTEVETVDAELLEDVVVVVVLEELDVK